MAYCTKCGTQVAEGVKFCTSCGTTMGVAQQPQPQPQTAPQQPQPQPQQQQYKQPYQQPPYGQPYRRQLDNEWKKADEIVREHHQSWEAVFTSLDADSRLCEAIVFPEVLRWSRLRNTIEQATLNMFYIRNGKKGADCSLIFRIRTMRAADVLSGFPTGTGNVFTLRSLYGSCMNGSPR